MQIRFIRMIDDLFRDVPHSRKVLELKEEIVQNLMEKYDDLRAEGKSEEDAYAIAAGSIGDIGDLVRELRKDDPFYVEEKEAPEATCDEPGEDAYGHAPEAIGEARERSASIAGTATILFILSPLPLLFFQSRLGLLLLVAMIAAGVGLLVFSSAMKPRGEPRQERSGSIVPGISDRPEADRKRLYRQVDSAFWLVVVSVYVLYSFRVNNWHISWVIFLFATAVSELMKIVLKPNPAKLYSRLSGALVVSSVGFYFIISFATNAWHITWVLILLGVALSNVVKAALQIKRG